MSISISYDQCHCTVHANITCLITGETFWHTGVSGGAAEVTGDVLLAVLYTIAKLPIIRTGITTAYALASQTLIQLGTEQPVITARAIGHRLGLALIERIITYSLITLITRS